MKKNNQKGFWIILFLLFALFGGMYLLQRQQEVRREAAYGEIGLSLLPSEKEVNVDENVELRLQVIPGQFLVNLVKIRLAYNPMVVELKSVLPQNNFSVTHKKSDGQVEIIALTTMAREELEILTETGSFEIARLNFEAVSPGETEISRLGEYAITGSRGIEGPEDRGLNLSAFGSSKITVRDKQELTPTPTEPPQGWPELTFKIKFLGTEYAIGSEQKVVSGVGTQMVDLLVKGNGISQNYSNVQVEFNEQAVGTGSLELVGVEPGDNYAVLIKGPVHLARRYCRDGQKEHCWLGEENISIVAGENIYDWTDLALEPGDIDGNGIVNSVDFTLLKNALGQEGEVKEDINFNGFVNTQDITFFLQTLSRKYEDDI